MSLDRDPPELEESQNYRQNLNVYIAAAVQPRYMNYHERKNEVKK